MTKKRILCEEAQEFLESKKPSTQQSYRSGLRLFREFYGKPLTVFLDRLDENAMLPRRQRKHLAEIELNKFIEFLGNKGLSNKSIRLYFCAMQNFLKYKMFEVDGQFIKLPSNKTKKVNRKHKWTISEIREFVNSANTMRDKAIIMVLFQSGMAISELCGLNYGDVCDELEARTLPLYLEIHRGKTDIEYRTFIGRDGVKFLKLYLETRKSLSRDSPLFTMQGNNTRRITDGAIQAKFRELSRDLSFIKQHELEGYNPVRPHSLRSAFRSRLTNKVDSDLIEYFMGHEIGQVKRAYINLPVDELRELYANIEHLLSIEKTSRDEMMGKDKKIVEIESKIKIENELFRKEIKKLREDLKEVEEQLVQQISPNPPPGFVQGDKYDMAVAEAIKLNHGMEKLAYLLSEATGKRVDLSNFWSSEDGEILVDGKKLEIPKE